MEEARIKKSSFLPLLVWYRTYYCYRTVLNGNIWLELELEPEPKLWTKVEPEPKINNFSSATLLLPHANI